MHISAFALTDWWPSESVSGSPESKTRTKCIFNINVAEFSGISIYLSFSFYFSSFGPPYSSQVSGATELKKNEKQRPLN